MFIYFLVMLCFGLLMLITLFLGGGDHDVSHEVTLVDHDTAAPSIHETQGTSHSSGLLQGWLSLKVISAFGTGFGATGWVATANGLSQGWSLACAIGSGLVIAFLIRLLIQSLRKSECNSSFSRSQLVGKQGTVILGILDGQTGEAQFVINGELVSVPAKSDDGKAISQGVQVSVVASGAVMVVKKA